MIILLHSGPGVVSWAIRAQTRGDYSHASVWFPNTGEVYESREWKGVQQIHVKDILAAIERNPKIRVEVFRLKHPHDDAKARAWLRAQVGRRYDYRSVFRFLTRIKPVADDSYFCSELDFDAVIASGHPRLLNCDSGYVSPVLLSISPLMEKLGLLVDLVGDLTAPQQEPIEGGMGQEEAK